MKKELNPFVVAGILILALGGVGAIFFFGSGGMYPREADSKSMPMPKEAAEMMAKMRADMEKKGSAPPPQTAGKKPAPAAAK